MPATSGPPRRSISWTCAHGDVARGLAVRGVPGWPWGEAAGAFVGGVVAVANGLEAGAVIEAANAAGARAVVTAYAPVGPVADALDARDVSLAASGLLLVRVRRDWDERLWPFASKGFFAFREHLAVQMP